LATIYDPSGGAKVSHTTVNLCDAGVLLSQLRHCEGITDADLVAEKLHYEFP
jgi:hypothetical protein